MNIENTYNCLGYYGFGSGVSLARKTRKNDPTGKVIKAPLYCNGCPQNKACWEIHRDRVRKIFPELTRHMDSLNNKQRIQFIKENKVDPYINLMMGNMEDAMNILSIGKPKDRGELTLEYPFKKL